jgi:DNA-binding CsgD family transcriptional regulator
MLASVAHQPPTAAQLSAIFVMKEWKLSPLEKTCLRWISRGRTLGEIASIEAKSVGDIESCLQNALVALEAKSITEALQKADLREAD